MPEEVFILFALLVMSTFGLTMTSMILRHRRRSKGATGSSEASMTTSDLEHMMRRAVEDATAPLTAKVEDLAMEIIRMGGSVNQLEAHATGSSISLDEIEQEEVLDVTSVSATRERN